MKFQEVYRRSEAKVTDVSFVVQEAWGEENKRKKYLEHNQRFDNNWILSVRKRNSHGCSQAFLVRTCGDEYHSITLQKRIMSLGVTMN